MCGIAGYLALDGGTPDVGVLQAMTDRVAHRGPDGDGLWTDGPVGLGHRRLSILDLSDSGRQPMTHGPSGCVITYNGEVYNYLELRAELEATGVTFNSGTDTEVMLAAYAAWGPECVRRFNGMWAFALFDPARRRVLCSRDPFGIKPFYYARVADALVFGSEIRQLLPLLPTVRANRRVVEEFLFSSRCEPLDTCFFEGVNKLPGGHNLTVDLVEGVVSVDRYYDFAPIPGAEVMTPDAAAERYGRSLRRSVALRLRSDVRVGTCLSGGLDSSTVATLAAEQYASSAGQAFGAITAVSEEVATDESGFARQVVEHGGLEWFTVRPDYASFVDSLPEVVRAQEEPFPTCSIVLQFHVMKTARAAGITVLLDGQGGDETLLGYERYYAIHLAETFNRRGLRALVGAVRDATSSNALMRPFTVLAYLAYFGTRRLRYWVYRARSGFLKAAPPYPGGVRPSARSVRETQEAEVFEDNLPALLRYEDKNSMWHGVEARLPFLDPETLELGLSLPTEAKIHEGWTKYPLRRYMDGRMPDSITWRKAKFGFEAPDDLWVARHSDVMLAAVKESAVLRSLCDLHRVERAFESMATTMRWKLYSVALWEREFGVSAEGA